MRFSIVLMFVGNVFFNALGNVLMKYGSEAMKGLDFKSPASILNHVILNPPLVTGVFCYVFSLVFYLFVLQKVNLSIAYPVAVASTAILVNLAAQFLLREPVSWSQISGCAVIVFGIFLIVKK